ncbi:MAG: GAK system CofD-like protein [Pseudomonadota bacterium]
MSSKIKISRTVKIPDPLRLARYERVPELGPKILFFSGGTALAGLSRKLVRFSHNSIHIMTPFDSGGSSAQLRHAFAMPSVGDLRSRLMALADQSVKGNPDIFRLFAYRLPKDKSNAELKERLKLMVDGKDPLIADIQYPMRKIIRTHLRVCRDMLPEAFHYRGASIGNLVLAGGYLANGRHIDPVIFLFSKLVEVRGAVRLLLNADLHLKAELSDGRTLVGQHLLTGKEVPPIGVGVRDVHLARIREDGTVEPIEIGIRPKIARLIGEAELICYPMGSFYSSVLANLLPRGVGRAIAETDCPKVYIPNTGVDPEQYGMTVKDSVDALLKYLRRDCGGPVPTEKLLNIVLLDAQNGAYPHGIDIEGLCGSDVQIVDTALTAEADSRFLDSNLLISALLSLI